MKERYPKVSIVTATYNMARYLGEAIESVRAQTYENYEHIIIDDGSLDNTREVVQEYKNDARIRYYHQSNKGQAAAKNAGILKSEGELICFLDGDNLWKAGKLARQVEQISVVEPSVGILYADIQMIGPDGRDVFTPEMRKYSGVVTNRLFLENFVGFNTVMIPKNVLEDIGLFDQSLTMGIDYDLWLRASVNYQFLYMPEKLVLYRIWPGQMSHKMGERQECVERIMKKFLKNHPKVLTKGQERRGWAKHYVGGARVNLQYRKYGECMKYLSKALVRDPFFLPVWKTLAKVMLP